MFAEEPTVADDAGEEATEGHRGGHDGDEGRGRGQVNIEVEVGARRKEDERGEVAEDGEH